MVCKSQVAGTHVMVCMTVGSVLKPLVSQALAYGFGKVRREGLVLVRRWHYINKKYTGM